MNQAKNDIPSPETMIRAAQYGGVGGTGSSSPFTSGGSSGGGRQNLFVTETSLDGLMARTHRPVPVDPSRNMEKRLEPFHTWAEEDAIPYNLTPKERSRLKLRKEVRRRERSYEECARSLRENSPEYIRANFGASAQRLMTMEQQLGARRRNEIADAEKREKGEDPSVEILPQQDPPTRRHIVDVPNFLQPVYAGHTTRFLDSLRLAGEGYSIFRQPNRMRGEDEGEEDDDSGFLQGRYHSQPELIGGGTTIQNDFQMNQKLFGGGMPRENADEWSEAFGDNDSSKMFWSDNFVSNEGINKPLPIPSAILPAQSDSTRMTLEQKLQTTKKDRERQRLPRDNSGVRDEYNAYKESPRGISEVFDAGAAPDVGTFYGNRVSKRAKDTLGTLRVANDSGEKLYNFYHGTRTPDLTLERLESRDPAYQGSIGPGLYVGQSRETAQYYAGDRGHVIDVPVRLKNPLLIDRSEEINFRYPPALEGVERDDDDDDYRNWPDHYYDHETGEYSSILPGERVPPFDAWIGGEWCEIRDHYSLANLGYWAKKSGHDAIILNNLRDTYSGPQEEVLLLTEEGIVRNPMTLAVKPADDEISDGNRSAGRVERHLSQLKLG